MLHKAISSSDISSLYTMNISEELVWEAPQPAAQAPAYNPWIGWT